jgi:hypothetical protein
MFSENQTNFNPYEQDINQTYPYLDYNEPDPFGNVNYNNITEEPSAPQKPKIDFPEETKNLLNQPLNGIIFPEKNNNEPLNSTNNSLQKELNNVIPHQFQEQQPSIIDGMILNCRNDTPLNSYNLITQSQLMGTEELSQLRSSIMPNKQLSQSNDEFIKVKGIPIITLLDYEDFQKNTVKQSRIPDIKAFIFKKE